MQMRTLILAGLALFSLLIPLPVSAQWTLGAQVGPARSKVSGDAPDKVHYRTRTGLTVSLLVEYAITPHVSVGVEPGYASRGTGLALEVPNVKEPVDTADLSLSYLTLPVLAKVYSGGRRAFVTAGLELGYLSEAELELGGGSESLKQSFQDTSVSALFGVGTRFRAGPAEWLLSVNYVQAIVSIVDSAPEDSEGFFPARFRTSGLEFKGGVLFQLGGGR
jgi:hypothetical protein